MVEVDDGVDLLLGLGVGLFNLHDPDFGAVLDQALALRRIGRVGRVVQEEDLRVITTSRSIIVLDSGDDDDWAGVSFLVHAGKA